MLLPGPPVVDPSVVVAVGAVVPVQAIMAGVEVEVVKTVMVGIVEWVW